MIVAPPACQLIAAMARHAVEIAAITGRPLPHEEAESMRAHADDRPEAGHLDPADLWRLEQLASISEHAMNVLRILNEAHPDALEYAITMAADAAAALADAPDLGGRKP